MHAITRNLITCAWAGCPQPGTVDIPHRSAATVYRLVDGTDRTHEAPVVNLEYCRFHADGILVQRGVDEYTFPVWIGATT